METIGKRFKEALEKIYGKSSSKKCADEFDEKHAQNIDRLKRSDTLPAKMRTIARKKGISLDWLETGEGDMLVDTSNSIGSVGKNSNINQGSRDQIVGESKLSPKEQMLLEYFNKASEEQKDKILLSVMQAVMGG